MEGIIAQPKISSGANSGSEQPGPIYWSQAHKLAFERLSFAATSGSPMTVFVGREGTGRTRLVRELIAKNTSDCVIRMMNNPKGLSGGVFSDVLSSFDPRRAYSDNVEQNRNELFGLLQSLHAADRYPVLVVDDADEMSNLYLGELCELCARSIDARPLLKLVFVGRPVMTDVLSGIRPDLMGPSFAMECMSKEDVRGFLQARLSQMGLPNQKLGKGAVAEAFALTSGIPARLELICEGLKRYTTLKQFVTKESKREIDKAQMREIGALVRINELSQKADALRHDEQHGVGIAGLANDAAQLEAEGGVGIPRKASVSEDGSDLATTSRGFGRAMLIAAGVVVALGAGALLLLPGADAFFKDRLAGSQVVPATPSADVPQDTQPVSEPVTVPAPEPEAPAEVVARIERIATALAGTEQTATGQYLAALDLAETAADAAAVAYARAALDGHARSAYYLGQIYETGEGVPVDLALAKQWYKEAGPEIEGAADRLRDMPVATGGVPSEPIQLYSQRMPDGALTLIWTSGEGADPSGYRIELSSAAREVVKSIPLVKTSAIRVTAPDEALLWRVTALDQTNETEVASPWIAIGP